MRPLKLVLALPLLFALSVSAELRLPSLLSDHAVLQRDHPVRIWGWSNPQEKVTIRFHQQTLTTQADAIGAWEAWLNPEPAGGPYALTVQGDSSPATIERKDILMGDVWFASGQSNMELPLEGFKNQPPPKDSDKEIAAATQPQIRLLLQKRGTSTVPLDDINDTWTLCTPDTARHFSAIAYLFGKELVAHEHVPIGLIDATWGGTPAHSWISPASLATANLTSVFLDAGNIARDQAHANQIRAAQDREAAALTAQGKPVPVFPHIPGDHQGSWTPGSIFNAMIAPDMRFTIKGVIWYQGESDSEPPRNPNYARVFSTLISDWRSQWAQGNFPFLFVQISSYNAQGGWPEVRDAQRRTLALSNTAMAVTLDVGESANVHPIDKQTVATRLALAARSMVYGEKVEYISPSFRQATTEPGAMRVWFTHADGLTSRGQDVGGFEVAGDDHKFQTATAKIEKIGDNETILVSSPHVVSPRFVRYDWQGYVTSYLYNAAGLPAGTFTSE
ncbi:MAG: sialate O-acetylesterase [Acidobacteriaceae bacterium]|nr:sialate O-acetylesterase [Acidobacteriaceae bacterium]